MKRFIFYIFFGLMAFSSAGGMFLLKYHVVEKEIKLSQMHRQILANNRSIHILKAEWTNLKNPKRLQVLVKENSSLQPSVSKQIIGWEQLDALLENNGGQI